MPRIFMAILFLCIIATLKAPQTELNNETIPTDYDICIMLLQMRQASRLPLKGNLERGILKVDNAQQVEEEFCRIAMLEHPLLRCIFCCRTFEKIDDTQQKISVKNKEKIFSSKSALLSHLFLHFHDKDKPMKCYCQTRMFKRYHLPLS